MSRTIMCPHCGVNIKISESWQNKSAICPKCSNRFKIAELATAPEVKPVSSPPPIRRRPQVEQVPEESVSEFDWEAVSDQEPEPDFEPPPTYRAPKAAKEENPSLGQILGTASLIVGVLGGLFLFLPCFWFLAVPVSALGMMLGFVGVFRKSGRPLSIAGLVLGAVLTFISGVLVLWAQANLGMALDRLRNL